MAYKSPLVHVDLLLSCTPRYRDASALYKSLIRKLNDVTELSVVKPYQEDDKNYYLSGTALIHPSRYEGYKNFLKRFRAPGSGLKFKEVQVSVIKGKVNLEK